MHNIILKAKKNKQFINHNDLSPSSIYLPIKLKLFEMREMKAAVFLGQENIKVMDIEEPEIGPNDVLIKTHYCGICGSDVEAYITGNYPEEIVIGHEISGEVKDFGENVEGFSKGQHVTVNSALPCGRCKYCFSGKPSLCEDLQLMGITLNGGCAELMVAPQRIVYKIPKEIDPLHAILAEPLSIVLHAIRISSFKPNDKVLVQGAGPIGLLTINVLKESGAELIIVSEPSEERRKIAEKVGADYTINPLEQNLSIEIEYLTDGEDVDMIFDAAGVPQTLAANFTLVKKGGEIIVIGITEKETMADFFTVVLNELTIKGSYLGYNEFPTAISMLRKGKIKAKEIITKIYPLEKVEEAFKELLHMPKEGKIAIKI